MSRISEFESAAHHQAPCGDALKICEIFYSLQGESSFAGQPCVFVRLSGCNIRCAWCDTQYAYDEGNFIKIDDIIQKIREFNCNLVEITGGEPMVQKTGACRLMQKLLDEGFKVLLETNGTRPLDEVPRGVHRIIDLKPPKSLTMHDEALWRIYAQQWRDTDEVKCVVADRGDFDWCIEKLQQYGAFYRVIVHFSAVWGKIDLATLAQWICDAHLPIRLNVQLQKIIWDPAARGV